MRFTETGKRALKAIIPLIGGIALFNVYFNTSDMILTLGLAVGLICYIYDTDMGFLFAYLTLPLHVWLWKKLRKEPLEL